LGGQSLGTRHLLRVDSNPLSDEDAQRVAGLALRQRLASIAQQGCEPLHIQLRAFRQGSASVGSTPWDAMHALQLDWTNVFADGRQAAPAAWRDHLIPALSRVRLALADARSLRVVCGGDATLSAAFALGVELRATTGFDASWAQRDHNGATEHWQLSRALPPSQTQPEVLDDAAGATELAVLISVTQNVRSAFCQSNHLLLPQRRVLHFDCRNGSGTRWLEANSAAQTAREVAAAIGHQLAQVGGAFQTIHLFLAGPVGLAFLLGRLSNTWPRTTLYEYPGSPPYVPGVTVEPSV